MLWHCARTISWLLETYRIWAGYRETAVESNRSGQEPTYPNKPNPYLFISLALVDIPHALNASLKIQSGTPA